MPSMNDVLGIIMGGGRGSRLHPLTAMRSKPAVPIAGKYRLIDIPISNCINSGIYRVAILTQFNSVSLHRHISQAYNFDVFHTGWVEILAAEQTPESADWYQGTADAVRKQLFEIQATGAEYVLILAGDHLYRMDYREMAGFHWEKQADITVAVQPVVRGEASRFGILKVESDGKISAFVEKPKDPEVQKKFVSRPHDDARPFLGSRGIYIFKTSVLIDLLTNFPKHDDFGGDIIPEAIKSLKVFGYDFDGYWEDIGTIRAFYEANLDLASPLPKFNFFDTEAPIYTRSRYLPPSKLQNCDIDNTMVSEGCILNGVRARRSIIGLRSRIDHGASIEDSIIMGSDFLESIDEIRENLNRGKPPIGIGQNTVIKRAIIDKNVRIGNNVRLVNKDNIEKFDHPSRSYYIREGIIIVPKNAMIPDGTEI